jgi:Ca-activated chloride channel homolog
MNVKSTPLSTMSVDVDRASYSNVRRFINTGSLPPADAVRIEEMVNYFDYDYKQPRGEDPIYIETELTDCPWKNGHKILHIGMQARKVNTEKLPPSNLVFLIDVSGSMESAERLPLLVAGMKLLVQNLRPVDKVAIVTYAGNAGLALPPTGGNNKQKILDVLDKLEAGGSTAGGAGIKLAYKVAAENFIKGGNNRVLLATDGDFNVGVSSENELEDLIVKERETGVYLTCLGFGTDNYKDSKMEMLADKGNGNYDYIDNIQEAQKTLVSEFGGTLFTIAKDVKAQIEFNPSKVQAYRLIGYEDRLLNTEDFKDDKKDAGDMGSGHTVTVMYELIPVGVKSEFIRETNDLKYQKPVKTGSTYSDELATIKFRYKKPDGEKSTEMVHTIADNTLAWQNASENTRFATTVAMFGMLLKNSKYKGTSNYEELISMADNSKSFDKDGYRAEFVRLVKAAKEYNTKTARE